MTSKLSKHFKLTVYRLSKSTLMPNALRFTIGRCFFWKDPRVRPFVHLVTATCIWGWVWRIGRVILTWKNRSPRKKKKNLFQCHFIHHKSQKDWPRKPSLHGNMWRLTASGAVNTFRLSYTYKPISDGCIRKTTGVYSEIHKRHINARILWSAVEFLMLNLVAPIATARI